MDALLSPITDEERRLLVDGDPRFAELCIFEGLEWRIYLNEDQRYLGRAYVWLKRHRDMHDITDLMPDEWTELLIILRTYGHFVRDQWGAAIVNYAWLGNEYHLHRGHAHMHVIPRYAAPPSRNGHTFPDERFGKNYQPYEKLKLPRPVLLDLADEVRTLFPRYHFE